MVSYWVDAFVFQCIPWFPCILWSVGTAHAHTLKIPLYSMERSLYSMDPFPRGASHCANQLPWPPRISHPTFNSTRYDFQHWAREV